MLDRRDLAQRGQHLIEVASPARRIGSGGRCPRTTDQSITALDAVAGRSAVTASSSNRLDAAQDVGRPIFATSMSPRRKGVSPQRSQELSRWTAFATSLVLIEITLRRSAKINALAARPLLRPWRRACWPTDRDHLQAMAGGTGTFSRFFQVEVHRLPRPIMRSRPWSSKRSTQVFAPLLLICKSKPLHLPSR